MPAAAVERRRERAVRTVPCAICGAVPGRKCRYPLGVSRWWSHAGRYRAAAAAGLVPPLPGEDDETAKAAAAALVESLGVVPHGS
jgi:hypothetical protein